MKIYPFLFTIICLIPFSGHSQQAENWQVLSAPDDTGYHQMILNQVNRQFNIRRQKLNDALGSKEKFLAYQESLRNRYRNMVGELPPKTPLNPVSTGIIDRGTYTIEKVAFESRPNHHVTANFYLPKERNGKIPGIYIPCGHSDIGKAATTYQKAASLFAINGFAVLIADPIGQGERFQRLGMDGQPVSREGTYAHTVWDVPANLLGTDVVIYELWDNIRGIDYLISRPEVDPERIGTSGNSGGGTMVTFHVAYDERIKVATPSCYIASKEAKFITRGPQDGCQQLPGETFYGIEEQDYLLMAAPKPIRILSAERDFFDFNGTKKVYAEMQRMYKRLEAEDRIDLVSTDEPHGWSIRLREGAVQWMKQWLMNDPSPVVEPEDLEIMPERDLWVTTTGQVGSYFHHEVLVTDLLKEEMLTARQHRQRFLITHTPEEIRDKIIDLTGFDRSLFRGKIVSEKKGKIFGYDENYRVEKITMQKGHGVPLPGILLTPKYRKDSPPLTLIVNQNGKEKTLKEEVLVREAMKRGEIILTVDVGGVGELKDHVEGNMNRSYENEEFRGSMLAIFGNQTLIAYKMADIITALQYVLSMENINTQEITLIGTGRLGPAVLHTAVITPKKIKVIIQNSITSWEELVDNPYLPETLPLTVPEALHYYDLSDLTYLIEGEVEIR